MTAPTRSHTAVVLGGGIGGIVAARSLRRLLDPSDRVVLVERDPVLRFAPSILWVMAGQRRPDEIVGDVRRLRRRGIEVVEAEVVGIDPTERLVETTAGTIAGDAIVVSLGANLAPDALEGFAENALNIYTVEGATDAHRALAEISSGKVAVVVGGTPYKCPAAPWEAAFLADALLRRRGVRDRTEVDVYTPEPLPMPVAGPAVGAALVGMLEARGIGFHPGRSATALKEGGVSFDDGSAAYADLVLGVPPHRPPAVLASAGLAPEGGYVPVDPGTLSAGEGVYVIGDAAAIPIAGGKLLPKAGVFAEGEARVVAARIAAAFAGRTPEQTFDGNGACFVELGAGSAAYASGNFYDPDGPAVALRRPGRHWHLAKVGFEQYWKRRWL